jgi:hypothetical protein
MEYYISGETINNICDVSIYKRDYLNSYPGIKNYCKKIIYIGENNNIQEIINNSKTFFIKVDWIDYFIYVIIPLIKNPFILVTHNGDNMSGEHNIILNNNLLVKWYGQNMNAITTKTECLPIGLENQIWNRTNFTIIDNFKSNTKSKLLYLNFNLNTNSNRKDIMNKLLSKNFKKNDNKNWNEYMQELSEYKFAISPQGNGVDCHRTWECLYLGVIPIITKSICMSFFEELPILFVDNYDCINEEYLLEEYKKIQNKRVILEKLDINYWKNKLFYLI